MNQTITIYHSPDADDAFMFYGLSCGAVNIPGYNFQHELSDIESLNHRAIKGEIDVTAVSVHAYAYMSQNYSILNCGASMGGADYGPRLVIKKDSAASLSNKQIKTIAIPGSLTSATLALRMYLHQHKLNAELVNIKFDQVEEAVNSGQVDAGLIIHEGQLTHEKLGLKTILDLGVWWWNDYKLPLPLGVNVIKKSLGKEASVAVKQALSQSINFSLQNRKAALDYALQYGRGISMEEADKFVDMYVNERTQDLAESGHKSIQIFLQLAADYNLIPKMPTIEFI